MAGGSADASGAAEKRVMYQQLSKGGTNAALTRHINFVAPAGEVLSGGQRTANEINDKGMLKNRACAPCLAGVQYFNKQFHVGRGQAKFNELFACLVYNGLGVGGTQCGRCVGLGSGSKCHDPPATAKKEVTALIKSLSAYNSAVKKTTGQALYSNLSAADKTAIDTAVEASKTFDKVWKGAIKSGAVETPKKKRKFDDMSTPSKELSTLQQSTNDTRTDVEKISMQLRTINTSVNGLRGEVDELRSLLRNARERDRWMVNGLQGIICHLNHTYAAENQVTNDDGTRSDPEPSIDMNDFDLGTSGFEDEVGKVPEGSEFDS